MKKTICERSCKFNTTWFRDIQITKVNVILNQLVVFFNSCVFSLVISRISEALTPLKMSSDAFSSLDRKRSRRNSFRYNAIKHG